MQMNRLSLFPLLLLVWACSVQALTVNRPRTSGLAGRFRIEPLAASSRRSSSSKETSGPHVASDIRQQPLSEDDSTDTTDDHRQNIYGKQTVRHLKELLKQRSLSCQGLKSDLIARLVDDDMRQTQSSNTANEPSLPTPTTKEQFDDAFSNLKTKLMDHYMQQSAKELKELATERALSTSGKKSDMAERITLHHILESTEMAFYLCNEEDDSDQEEDGLSAWTGYTPEASLFEPGKLSLEFVIAAVQHFKEQRQINRCYVFCLLKSCCEHFRQEPSLLKLSIPKAPPPSCSDDVDAKPRITVCGDTHGQFYDFLHIFDLNGYPHRNNPYVFNGDFVDRGAFSVEIVLTLLLFKLYDPECVHLLRGNHETSALNSVYGFAYEVGMKYNSYIYELFTDVFQWLPLAAVIGKKVFVAHGGIPGDETVMLKDIRKIKRGTEPSEAGIMFDLMWSDPMDQPGSRPSGRGGLAKRFGPDVTAAFLERNKLDLLVRSHEVRMGGYSVEQDGKTITVFSAPNYCDRVGNKGAFIHFDKTLKPVFTQFDNVPHP